MDLAAVNAQVRRILTAPNVDLATISSKKVRKELAETFGAGAVKENKEAIDALIIEQFNQIAIAAGATQAPSSQQAGAVKTEEGTSNGDAHHATEPAQLPQSNGYAHASQSSAVASAGSSAVASTSAGAGAGASASKQQQRERDRVKQQQAESDVSEEEDASGSDSDAPPPPPKPKTHAQSASVKSSPQKQRLQGYTGLPMESSPSIPLSLNAGLTDEEYARKLQAELNAGAFGAGTRATRGGGFQSNAKKGKRKQSSSSKSEGKSKGGKKYRSKAYIEDSDLEGEDGRGRSNDDDDDSESEGSDTPKPKKKRKAGTGNTGGGYNKELALSEPLQKVCRQPTMSRPQIVKRLWEYIRENNLQDPKKKSDIINDDLFKEIFGVEKMTMFSMNKYLTKNVSPIEG